MIFLFIQGGPWYTSRDGGYSIFKFRFDYIIWWWHFGYSDEWTLESETILSCLVKNKPMQLDAFSKICFGSVTNCLILNSVSRESSCAPSVVPISWFDQFLDLTWKSLINSTKFDWPLGRLEMHFSRLARNASNLPNIWLCDRYKEIT